MASKIVQAFKQKDIRNKILMVVFILFLYRLGASLPVPGIPLHDIADQFKGMNEGVMALLSLMTGNALTNMSVLSLGILPYITSSIILQLMSLVFPQVAAWKRDGGEGRKKIIKWTRFLTLALATINAIGYDLMFQAQYGIVYPGEVPGILSNLIVVFTLVVGCILVMFAAEAISRLKIVGNGMSVLVFAGIMASIPSAVVQSVQTAGEGAAGIGLTVAIIVFIIIVLPIVVEVERAQRRVPIKSTKAGANSMYARSTETNYIPVPVDLAGLYGLIFSSCFTMLPVYLAAWFTDVQWLQQLSAAITAGPVSWAVTFVLVIAFCFFMAGVNFNSDDIADNLKKQGSYVPGVRPGNATAEYFTYIVNHITLFGSVFIACLAVAAAMLFYFTNNPLLAAFGGTSLIIAINTSILMMTSIEQQVRSSDPEAVLRRLGR